MKAQGTQSVVKRLRKYSPEVLLCDKRPLLDEEFVFPWKQFCESINETLHLALELAPLEREWKEFSEIDAGICAPYKTLNFVFPGIQGGASLLISTADIDVAMQAVLQVPPSKIVIEDQSFHDQFWLFLLTEFLSVTQTIAPLASLAPRLKDCAPLEQKSYLCQDIAVHMGSMSSVARLALSSEFLDSYRGVWQQKNAHGKMIDAEVAVAVEAARFSMGLQEIRDLQVGDWVVLDHPFYTPASPKARVFLTYQDQPLFRAKLEEGKLTILEMPLVHEAFLPQGGHFMDTSAQTLSEDEKNLLLEVDPLEGEEKSAEPSPVHDQETARALAISKGLLKEPFDVEKVPLSVAVQAGAIRLTVKELSELQPGNVLDLSVRPEDGVTLVTNGLAIGRGSLVLIGDNLGVQITELYKA